MEFDENNSGDIGKSIIISMHVSDVPINHQNIGNQLIRKHLQII